LLKAQRGTPIENSWEEKKDRFPDVLLTNSFPIRKSRYTERFS
jgi:hypothetical protein